MAQRALRVLAGFAEALKIRYDDIEVGLDFDPEPGLADNGDLEHDLQALLEAVAAGLRQLPGRMGRAKCCAERLFDFPVVGPPDATAAGQAIAKSVQAQNVQVTGPAIADIVARTQGHPYLLREWAKHGWDHAAPADHKGMVWSPNHGDTAFTVPLFDAFMKRVMPGDDWRSP